jgi:hypothetical protein
LISPDTVYIESWKDSTEACEQLVAWNAGILWQYVPFVDDMVGLIISAEYNAHTTLSGVPAIVIT